MNKDIKYLDDLREELYRDSVAFGNYLVRLGKPVWLHGRIAYKMDAKKLKSNIIHLLNEYNNRHDDICSTVPIPFAIECPRDDDYAEFYVGLAAKEWVVELMEWLLKEQPNLPSGIYDSIVGILCGYDSESIQKFIDNRIKVGK